MPLVDEIPPGTASVLAAFVEASRNGPNADRLDPFGMGLTAALPSVERLRARGFLAASAPKGLQGTFYRVTQKGFAAHDALVAGETRENESRSQDLLNEILAAVGKARGVRDFDQLDRGAAVELRNRGDASVSILAARDSLPGLIGAGYLAFVGTWTGADGEVTRQLRVTDYGAAKTVETVDTTGKHPEADIADRLGSQAETVLQELVAAVAGAGTDVVFQFAETDHGGVAVTHRGLKAPYRDWGPTFDELEARRFIAQVPLGQYGGCLLTWAGGAYAEKWIVPIVPTSAPQTAPRAALAGSALMPGTASLNATVTVDHWFDQWPVHLGDSIWNEDARVAAGRDLEAARVFFSDFERAIDGVEDQVAKLFIQPAIRLVAEALDEAEKGKDAALRVRDRLVSAWANLDSASKLVAFFGLPAAAGGYLKMLATLVDIVRHLVQ